MNSAKLYFVARILLYRFNIYDHKFNKRSPVELYVFHFKSNSKTYRGEPHQMNLDYNLGANVRYALKVFDFAFCSFDRFRFLNSLWAPGW